MIAIPRKEGVLHEDLMGCPFCEPAGGRRSWMSVTQVGTKARSLIKFAGMYKE
jgi:hypothetical protein